MVKNRLNDDIIDFLRRDDHASDFLNICYDNGGSSDVKTLRYELGLGSEDSNVLNYRFKKLEENNLIEIEYDESITRGNRSAGKVAFLTDLGKEVIQSDLVEPSDDLRKDSDEITLNKNDLEELKEEYEKTNNRLKLLEEKLEEDKKEKSEDILKRLEKIEMEMDPEYTEQWRSTVQNYLKAIRSYIEMKNDVDLENYIDEEEELIQDKDQKRNQNEDDFEYIE